MSQEDKKVSIYTSPTCHFCHLAKDFFDSHEIAYEEYDVMTDIDKRQEMIEKSGQMGVPVIVIDDQVITGFDEQYLARIFNIQI